MTKKIHSSTPTARKRAGYESVRELFEDNYHEDPIYKSESNTSTEVRKEK